MTYRLALMVFVATLAWVGVEQRNDGAGFDIGAKAFAQDDDDDDDDGDDGDDDDDDGGGSGGGGSGGGSSGGGTGGGTGGGGGDDDDDGDDDDGGDDAGRGDDDDDDDDGTGGRGDDDDDEDERAEGGGPASEVVAVPARAPRIDTRRGAGDRSRKAEISALDLGRAELQRLTEAGFQVIETRPMGRLSDGVVARLRPPARLREARALELARQVAPQAIFDLSHIYGASEGPGVYGPVLVRFPAERPCSTGVRIGMIDGAVADHPMLRGARINRKSFTADAASAAHGTAVASVLVGRDPSGRALLGSTQLFAAAVFSREGGETSADAIDVAAALDWLSDQRVGVVNLSIAGPENDILRQTVARATEAGMILVAAGGNGGAGGKPRYPAAYPEVIAVSAVDQRGRPYRSNTRGAYIDIAAPGVDIWAADARGPSGALWSGTSFAAPFVTVELAAARKAGAVRGAASAQRYLAGNARDLGARGVDSVYGAGLVQSAACR